jgi:hypothetical protein
VPALALQSNFLERQFKMKAQTIEIQESTGRILSSAALRLGAPPEDDAPEASNLNVS